MLQHFLHSPWQMNNHTRHSNNTALLLLSGQSAAFGAVMAEKSEKIEKAEKAVIAGHSLKSQETSSDASMGQSSSVEQG